MDAAAASARRFLAARVSSDWPALRGTLRGCRAVLRAGVAASVDDAGNGPGPASSGPGDRGEPRLTAAAARAVAAALAGGEAALDVPAQPQPVRSLALRALRDVLRGHPGALAGGVFEATFAAGLVAAVDGEADPRCLLVALDCVAALAALYDAGGDDPTAVHPVRPEVGRAVLAEQAEDVVDVLSCYFPVVFTPPPHGGDPGVTREAILAKLVAALVAARAFVPPVVALACAKMTAPKHETKIECLDLLAAVAARHGPASLWGHRGDLWASVRLELVAPAAEGLRWVAARRAGSSLPRAFTRRSGAPPAGLTGNLVAGAHACRGRGCGRRHTSARWSAARRRSWGVRASRGRRRRSWRGCSAGSRGTRRRGTSLAGRRSSPG